jgi:hypothetical protein
MGGAVVYLSDLVVIVVVIPMKYMSGIAIADSEYRLIREQDESMVWAAPTSVVSCSSGLT